MAWLTANWFWVLVLIGFVAMHVFGHGCHGGHGKHDRQRNGSDREDDVTGGSTVNTSSSSHHR